MHEVLREIADQGGVAAMEKQTIAKSDLVYGRIDARPRFYIGPVEKASRSRSNVVFRLPTEELEKKFLKEAEARSLVGLKGHRSVGGVRASLYVALPVASVEALATFMDEFALANDR
jgi:phosphoserine aminotransferase